MVLNFTGNGMVAPYLVIYLHFGRLCNQLPVPTTRTA